jgi:hypothetical protein
MAKQPWEVPDLPTHGDQSKDDTFRAVGAALSQREYFEGNLTSAFSYLIGSGYGNIAALRAYGSVETFRGRANMIETAAEVYLRYNPDAALQSLLDEIIKRSRQFSARRNEIAHGIVSPLDSVEFTFAYSSVEINAFCDHFDQLGSQAVELLTRLAAHSMRDRS